MSENNGFKVFSTITDDKGDVWEIAHSRVYGHFVLMKPEKQKPSPQIIPVVSIKGKDYVLLEDVRRVAGQLAQDSEASND